MDKKETGNKGGNTLREQAAQLDQYLRHNEYSPFPETNELGGSSLLIRKTWLYIIEQHLPFDVG